MKRFIQLTKITTRTETTAPPALLTALAAPKTTRDERDRRLNSQLGLLLTETLSPALRETLQGIQHEIFELGGELANTGPCVHP